MTKGNLGLCWWLMVLVTLNVSWGTGAVRAHVQPDPISVPKTCDTLLHDVFNLNGFHSESDATESGCVASCVVKATLLSPLLAPYGHVSALALIFISPSDKAISRASAKFRPPKVSQTISKLTSRWSIYHRS